jgi:hypothetical protein
MKLFNKTIDRQLFKQYSLGSDLSKQEVVVKIFNPYGKGTWFILNSDPNDPDYLWAIVDLGYGAEVGSVSRTDLETYRGKFGMGFERDLSFDPVNAEELYKGLRLGEFYAKGGKLASHGLQEGDTVVKTIDNFQKVKTKNGSIVYVDLESGYRDSQPPLPFKKGGELPNSNYSKGMFADGGEVSFIEYKDSEIMYEPHYKKYYANDVEFDSLQKAKDFIDSEETDEGIRDAYSKGLFTDGGNLRQSLEEVLKQDVTFLKFDSGRAYDSFKKLNVPHLQVHDYDFNHYSIIKTENLNKVLEYVKKGIRVVKKKFTQDDLGFDYKGTASFADGGNIQNFSDNQRMIMNQNVEVEHHQEELEDILEDEMPVPAWVVAKMETATQNLSDVTHYLDGQKELMEDEDEDEDEDESMKMKVAEPMNMSAGTKAEITKKFTDDAFGNLKGFLKGMEGIELRNDYTFDYKDEQFEIEPIINSDENGVSNAVFTVFDGDGEEQGEITYSSEGGKQKFTANSEFFSWNNTKFENGGFMADVYADGGETEEGVNLFEDYENIPAELQAILDKYEDAFQDGDYSGLEKALKEANKIGYTFEYYLDGQAYDLRKIGEKGKSEFENYAKGGEVNVEKLLKAKDALNSDILKKINELSEEDSKKKIIIFNKFPNMMKGSLFYTKNRQIYFQPLIVNKYADIQQRNGDVKPTQERIQKVLSENKNDNRFNYYIGHRYGMWVLYWDEAKGNPQKITVDDMFDLGIGTTYFGALQNYEEKFADGGEVDNKFNYMMLSRLQRDCDYYLGYGNRSERGLWAGNVDAQIKEMKRLWNNLPKDGKPEWLTMEDILDYENKMKNQYAKGGMVVTSIKDIPSFEQKLKKGEITYRGLGMGKLSKDFYNLAGTSGVRIKVDKKEYFITDEEFNTFSRDSSGNLQIRFDAPARRNENGGFMNDVYAKGGSFEKVRWQDVEKGDSARVKELNRMGLITHTYGRKFNLKFPNGTEKTFDASDLEFFKLEKDQYELDNRNNYAKGGNLDVVDLYNDFYIKGYENKAYQFAYVPEFLGKETVTAYSLGLEDGGKRNKKDYESFEEAIGKAEQKTNKPKYINHDNIKTVTLNRKGKEVTYKGADVLNGANVFAEGGDVSSKANYVPKRDVVEVELKDGSKVKPVNGYWIKKGAEPIGAEPTPISSGSSEPKIGTTEIRKDPRGNWRAETKVKDFNNYDWKITTIKTSSGNLLTSAQGGKYEQGNGYTTFKFVVFQDPNHTLEVSKPSRLTEKVVAEQHAKGLVKFQKFMETGMFKGGGKISNFDKLSAKVANEYEGKPVQSKYQEEYGKYYSKEEAQEVGDKVAGKVKATQVDSKAFGGLFNSVKNKVKPQVFPDLEYKMVTTKDGQLFKVINQSDNLLFVLDPDLIGSGVRPHKIDISEIDPTSYKLGGKIANERGSKGSEIFRKANELAKEIRKDGESWNDAKKRAFAQLKK